MVATTIAAAFCLIQPAAKACEGCKQSVGLGDGAKGSFSVNLIGLGYGLSILFMLFMVGALISGLVYMMYRNCQVIAARQNALLAEEETRSYGNGSFQTA